MCLPNQVLRHFIPVEGRLIIPRNPHLRLGTRSRAEWFLLMVLVAIAYHLHQYQQCGRNY